MYAKIRLTPSEALPHANTPVVYNPDIGFFFEPDASGVIKICDEFPGFTHNVLHRPYGAVSPRKISVPRSHAAHPTDTYPDESEVRIRKALEVFLPSFVQKPLFDRALCWCNDTPDAALLVCEHPRWKNFVLATGDSGHTFKLLPNIGSHVVELLEGRLSAELAEAWRWRPGSGDAVKSRRAARAKDLGDLKGWKHDAREKL